LDKDPFGHLISTNAISTQTDQNTSEQSLLARLINCIEPHNADQLAGELLSHFVTLTDVLNAVDQEPLYSSTVDEKLHALLSSVKALTSHLFAIRAQSDVGPDVGASLKHYLYANMAHLEFEEVRAIFLDNKLHLASDVVLARGTNAEVHTTPREIFRHALAQNSGAFILVHNHPSGRSKPSEADVQFTHNLAHTAKMLEITFIDHLIIARDGCTSLRDAGLMPPL
jgi:DNA repair protein RadC